MTTPTPNLLSSEPRRRYPGPRPFMRTDRHIFRGRDREVGQLLELTRQYPHLLLYARSGIGKSSLIEAGLIPKLEDMGQYLTRKIVFGAYNQKVPIPPLDATILDLQKISTPFTYLDKLIFQENSLWYQLKRLQAWYGGDSPEPGQQFLLIFDQFEELFTYPPEDIAGFKTALSEALFTQIPDAFRAALRAKEEAVRKHKADPAHPDEELPPPLTHQELELLHRPLHLRVLFSIRSDRMALLNQLTDCLPEMLKNCYEIKPLTRAQCQEAITVPAAMPDDFASPPFHYDPALLEDILNYLARDQEQYIESFQIQIICKHIEDLVVETQPKPVVTKADVPVLENIFLRFYEKAMGRVPDLAWYERQQVSPPDTTTIQRIRHGARMLVEKGLIFRTGEEQGIRLNLYREQIAQQFPDVDDAALYTLSQERMLRDNPDPAGRMRYELAHDTLVKPILRALDARERESRERADQEERARLEREEAVRKSREIGVSGKIDIDWEYIERCIHDGRAVLILGENALQDEAGVPLFNRFVESLNIIEHNISYYEEDQLFWFKDQHTRKQVAYQMRQFYKNLTHQQPLFQMLAAIHFPLVLSLDPSDLVYRQLSNHSSRYFSEFYNYNEGRSYKGRHDERSGGILVYNLLGNVREEESLLITPEDVYRHLYGVLGNKPLPDEVRDKLDEAKVFIFYGVNLQRHVNEILLWQISRANHDAMRLWLHDEPSLGKEELRAKAFLNIDFQNVRPEHFFGELAERLRSKPPSSGAGKSSRELSAFKETIREMVERGELDLAIQSLLNYTRSNEETYEANEEVIINLTALLRRLKQFSNTYLKSVIDSGAAQAVRNQITHGLFNILDAMK